MLIGIVVSDQRQRKIAELLIQHDFRVVEIMSEKDLKAEIDVLVLPMKGVNDKYQVVAKDFVLDLKSFFERCKEDLVIYCGIKCKYLDNYHFKVITLLDDEDIVEYNSKLTAQGLLIDLLLHIQVLIDEVSIDLIGFGHSGKAIYEMYSKINDNIRIVSSKNMSSYDGFPVNMIDYKTYESVSSYGDVIINTAPAKVLNANIIHKLKPSTIILDIASEPGGTDFECAKKCGIAAYLLPALPSKYVNDSASRILGEKIIKDVDKDE